MTLDAQLTDEEFVKLLVSVEARDATRDGTQRVYTATRVAPHTDPSTNDFLRLAIEDFLNRQGGWSAH